MGRTALSLPSLLALSVTGCLPSDFDAVVGETRTFDAAIMGDGSLADADSGPADAGLDSGPADASVQTVEVSLTRDEDDCLWCVVEGSVRELLHYGPEDGADGYIVEVGTDSEDCRTGLRFALPLPPGARVQSASLWLYRVGPEDDTAPEATMRVQLFDSAAPPACTPDHAHDVPAQHAEGGLWPTWIGGYVVGPTRQLTESPDLATLVQHAVDRPDWEAGRSVMLFVAPDAMANGQFAQFRDSYAGEYPPRLVVRYTSQ